MGVVDWIRLDLDQDTDKWWALVSKVVNLRIPLNAGNFLGGCATVGFSRRTRLYTVS
jgi:hypothetical protein